MRGAAAAPPAGAIRRLLRSGRPLVWTGRGVSLALAEAFAATCRALGATAFAVGGPEVTAATARTWAVCSVSRSGWTPGPACELVVAEEPGRAGPGAPDVLLVPNAGEPATAWFPQGFAREAVWAFAAAAGIVLPVAPALELAADRRNLVLLSSSAAAASRLVTAAEFKLGPLELAVAEAEEFGHGLHSRVATSPGTHALHVVCRDGEPEPELSAWCGGLDVPVRVARVNATAAAFPLVALLAALDAVRVMCTALRIDAGARPIPDHLDHIRGGAPRGRASCV